MKIRQGFVTNSSSASYICLFARVTNNDIAEYVADQYPSVIELLTAQEVLDRLKTDSYWLKSYSLDVDCSPSEEYIKNMMDNDQMFATVEEYQGDLHPSDYDEDFDGDIWNWDPGEDVHSNDVLNAIDAIKTSEGFTDVYVQRGYGFDG